MGRPALLTPDSQFPDDALRQSVQMAPPSNNVTGNIILTLDLASAADTIPQWGRVVARDQRLRKFWPTETLLAGTVAEMALKNSSYTWEIRHASEKIAQAQTDMLNSSIAGDSFGWIPFMQRWSQDGYTQDNGQFIEIIREEGADANSAFKAERAPVIGIANLDAARCQRTGNPEYPVIYTDRQSQQHKLAWYQVIPMSDFPSSMETMNGVGYCAVTRCLRYSQIMRSIFVFKDEKISGRRFKSIHIVSGVSRTDLDTAKQRGREEADNEGNMRYIDPVILASLDPEKPVSTVTIDLASLPEGFDFDQEMRWYVTDLALGFNTDYQTIAPLASGNIGSSSQSQILHRKASGKSPVRKLFEAFKNYGVLVKNSQIVLQDQNEEEELEKQLIRTKAMEEYALSLRNYVLTPDASRKDLVRRNIYTAETVAGIPEEYGIEQLGPKPNLQPVGGTGGNTIAEDNKRQDTGAQKVNASDNLRKGASSTPPANGGSAQREESHAS